MSEDSEFALPVIRRWGKPPPKRCSEDWESPERLPLPPHIPRTLAALPLPDVTPQMLTFPGLMFWMSFMFPEHAVPPSTPLASRLASPAGSAGASLGPNSSFSSITPKPSTETLATVMLSSGTTEIPPSILFNRLSPRSTHAGSDASNCSCSSCEHCPILCECADCKPQREDGGVEDDAEGPAAGTGQPSSPQPK